MYMYIYGMMCCFIIVMVTFYVTCENRKICAQSALCTHMSVVIPFLVLEFIYVVNMDICLYVCVCVRAFL